MRNVYDCVEAFEKLLDKEYHLVLGRKNISVSLQINFDKKECFHLMGLQYLTDRPELVHDRGKIFDAIRKRRITAEQIQSSDLYYRIAVFTLLLISECFNFGVFLVHPPFSLASTLKQETPISIAGSVTPLLVHSLPLPSLTHPLPTPGQ